MILFPNGIQGLSDTKWSGVRGSAHKLVGIDYRSEPGAIQAHQKMTKFSPSSGGNQVTELCKVGLPLSDGSTLWFSSESGKIWREVSGTFTLVATLTIPGYLVNLATSEDTGKLKLVSAEVDSVTDVKFKPDGLSMYVLGAGTVSGNLGEVFQYTLSTAFDVSTAVYASKMKALDLQSHGLAFSTDGTKLFVSEDSGGTSVITYTLGTPWDVSTAGAAGTSYNFSAQGTRGYYLEFKSDGTKMVIFDITSGYEVNQYNLSVAWDVSTATFIGTFSLPTFNGAAISLDGTRIFLIRSSIVTELILSTPWDVTTAALTTTDYAVSGNFTITIAPDSSGFYTQNDETVYQYKLTPAVEDLNVKILSAAEFGVPDGLDTGDEDTDNDEMTQYVYFATKNWLFRISLANITDWTKYEYLTLFKYGDDTYHPVRIANNRLFFGDRYTILQVDEAGVITLESDLNVREPERITILHNFDVDLLVGTKRLDEKSRILRWDTESETWYGEDIIYEGEIHAFLDEDNYTYAIVGDFGDLHYYDGEKLLKHIRIPGSYNNAAKCKVNANAVGYFMGIPIFGVSNITGNPTLQGIYSYGQYSKDYNITLDLSFPISSGEFAGLEIGAIIVRGTDVYAAWKSSTAVGIDKLDWTAKYNGAYIETMVLNNAEDRSKFKSFDRAAADYIEMPTDTEVLMQYSLNYGTYIDFEQVNDDKLFQLRSKATVPEIGAMQLKFTFTCNGNDSPKIENFHGDFQGEE
jgi:hypothetical protein